ncbi:hypothetical protein PAEPH01_2366 [Pancytospora epiphaga]|nr:hypothetical protein PAEPH01_2366 [Pancytospora epiphaga]
MKAKYLHYIVNAFGLISSKVIFDRDANTIALDSMQVKRIVKSSAQYTRISMGPMPDEIRNQHIRALERRLSVSLKLQKLRHNPELTRLNSGCESLHIMTINVNGLATKAEKLLELVSLIHLHIICVQKTLHNSYHRNTYMHGYMTIESPAEGPHRGLMFAIRKDIAAAAAQIIKQSHNIMAVLIRNRKAEMIICNIYIDRLT